MRFAVIGAGVAGLVAGERLTAAGHDCDVYERWPGLGGQAATLDVGGGTLLERYYHVLFRSDVHIRRLYEEIGLPDELEWHRSSVAVFADGRVHPFTTPLDLLRFRPLALRTRARVGLATLRLHRRYRTSEALDDVTAREWVEREMGPDAYARVWGPLLHAKFGDHADRITMAWLWSKLTLRRQVKGEQLRDELLGYPRGSWQPLFDRLAERIESRRGRVLIDCPAASISRDGDGFSVVAGAPESFRRGHDPRRFETRPGSERYDGVVATVPSDVFQGLLDAPLSAALAPDARERIAAGEYTAALCVLLELDRPFTRFYWTNVCDLTLPFIGLVEHTNLVGAERYGGRRFLYVANYLLPGDRLLALSLDELLDTFEPGLRRVNPRFERGWIRNAWRFAEPAGQPVVTTGYARRIPPLRTGVPGLILANTTQVYPEDRGTNYAVRLADEAVSALLADVRAPAASRA